LEQAEMTMRAVIKPPREPVAEPDERGRPPVPADEAAPAVADYLDHFRQIATMVEVLDRLPELAGDIRDWRPASDGGPPSEAGPGPKDEILQAFGDLSPLTRRAFEAVVAGIDKLAESAVDLYDHTHQPPTPDEIKAGAEIGHSMRQLLDRAMALVEPPDGGSQRRTDPSSRK
jgi:hypothetical protein